MGKFFGILETWRDSVNPPGFKKPSWNEVAEKLDVYPNVFKSWRNPKRAPDPANVWAVHELTGVSYEEVAQALLEDLGVADAERAKEANILKREGKSQGRQLRKDMGEAGEGSQIDPDADDGGA